MCLQTCAKCSDSVNPAQAQNITLLSIYIFSSSQWVAGGAKVSCILRHRGVQLILAYSWASPATLVAGNGGGVGGGGSFFFFTFSPVPFSSLSLSFIFSTISSVSFPPFPGRRHRMIHKD